MDEVMFWESKWKNTIQQTTDKLNSKLRFELQKSPFDTWAYWHKSQAQRRQGWKIHLSPHPEILDSVMDLICNLQSERTFEFKLISSYTKFMRLNAGFMGESQVGKTITIYPEDDIHCIQIYKKLQNISQQFIGPKSPGDFYFSFEDGISFRWGQFGAPHTVYDSLGKPTHFIENERGEWIKDDRSIPGVQPQGVQNLKLDHSNEIAKPLPVDTPQIIQWGLRQFIVKQNFGRKLKQVLLVEDLVTQNLFILKRVWNGLGITAGGRTYKDEALNESLRTQYLKKLNSKLHASVLNQRQTEYFFESLMEDAGGDSLEKLPPTYVRQFWPLILESVELIHKHKLVHRDLKRRNFVLKTNNSCPNESQVLLIDFELAGLTKENLPCSSGTHSFKAPEAEKGAPFSEELDIYALGSILFEITLGREPNLYLICESARVALLRLNGFQKAADLIQRIYGEPHQRPSLNELRNFNSSEFFKATHFSYEKVKTSEIKSAAYNAIKALDPFMSWSSCHTQLHWKNNHLLSTVNHRGMNIGSSGILVGLLELYDFIPERKQELEHLIKATVYGLINSQPYEKAHGFMTGNAGVAYAIARAGVQMREPQWIKKAVDIWKATVDLNSKEFDFFSGMAGILFVGIYLNQVCKDNTVVSLCESLVEKLVTEVIDYEGIWAWSPSQEFSGLPTLGASHGASGIAMVLGLWSKFSQDDSIKEFSIEIFQRIFKYGKSQNEKSLRYDIDPNSQPRGSTDWCHGAAGYLWAILNSLNFEEQLKLEIEWAKDLFIKSNIANNPTYCHGLAGQLELSILLEDNDRIERLKRALLLQRRDFNSDLVWCSENPDQFTPDLWVGFLGPAVALARSELGKKQSLFFDGL